MKLERQYARGSRLNIHSSRQIGSSQIQERYWNGNGLHIIYLLRRSWHQSYANFRQVGKMDVSKSNSAASVALICIPTPGNADFKASLLPEYNIFDRTGAVSGFQVNSTNLDVGRPSSVVNSKSINPYRQSFSGNALTKSSYVFSRDPLLSMTIVFLSLIIYI